MKIWDSPSGEIFSAIIGFERELDKALDIVNSGIEKKGKSGWVNKGAEGEHGKFKTKKGARAQQEAMYANGFRGSSYVASDFSMFAEEETPNGDVEIEEDEFNPDEDIDYGDESVIRPEPDADPNDSFDEGMKAAVKKTSMEYAAGDIDDAEAVDAFVGAGFDSQEAQDMLAKIKMTLPH